MMPRQRRNIQRGSRCVRGLSAGASGPSSQSAACVMSGIFLPADYSFRMQANACRQAVGASYPPDGKEENNCGEIWFNGAALLGLKHKVLRSYSQAEENACSFRTSG